MTLLNDKCDVCGEKDATVGCSDGVMRCDDCALEDGFNPATGNYIDEDDEN